MKYRNKTVIVKAFRFGFDDIPEWFTYEFHIHYPHKRLSPRLDFIARVDIKVPVGTLNLNIGDWIVKEGIRKLYNLTNYEFQDQYEKCDEEEIDEEHSMPSMPYYFPLVVKDISCGPWSPRILTVFKENNIKTLFDLVQKTGNQLRKLTNFGSKSLNDVNMSLGELGLSLGLTEEEFNTWLKINYQGNVNDIT